MFHTLGGHVRANLVGYAALFIALGGTGIAATSALLPSNSVGPKQLRNGAVTTAKVRNGAITRAKIRNGAVTAAKVAPGSLTGAQINAATLGTVPAATHADRATTADGVAASEAFHDVGAPGEPAFQNSWQNSTNTFDEPAGFYKDREGVVHLRGQILGGAPNTTIFQLPSGYRPAAGKAAEFAVACECSAGAQTAVVAVAGSGFVPTFVGSVTLQNAAFMAGNTLHLDGISFRAES